MIGESFKQQCPTCDAMVLVKSPGLIGKRMECPKCKDHFLVAKPAMQSSADDDDDAEESAAPPPAKRAAAAAPSGKAKVPETYGLAEEKPAAPPRPKNATAKPSDETRGIDDEDDDSPPPAKKAPVKMAPRKPAAQDDDEEDDGVEIHFEPAAKKKVEADDDDEDDDEKPARPAIKKMPLKHADEEEDDEEEEEDDEPARKTPPKSKANAEDEDEEDEDDEPLAKAAAKKAAAKPKVQDEDDDEEAADEDEEEERPKPAKKGIVKTRSRTEEDEEEDEDEAPKSSKAPVKSRGKADEDEDEDEEDEEEEAPKSRKKAPIKSRSKKSADDDEEEEEEEEEETDGEPAVVKKSWLSRFGSFWPKKSKNSKADVKAAKSKPAKAKDADDDEAAEDEGAEKKTKRTIAILGFQFDRKWLDQLAIKAGSRKTAIGVGLAIVGVMVLVGAGYLIFFREKPASNQQAIVPGKKTTADPKKKDEPVVKSNQKIPDTNPVPIDEKPPKEEGPPLLKPADPSLTNLLPADADQVIRVNLGNLFAQKTSPFYQAAFQSSKDQPGPFVEKILEKKFGFSPLKADEVIHAQRFSSDPWSFTVVHVRQKINLDAIVKALNLGKKEDDDRLRVDKKSKVNVDYYEIPENAWLEQFSRLAPGFPIADRQLRDQQTAPRGKGRPLYLHLHDNQTLILADKSQMFEYLQKELYKASEKQPAGGTDTFATQSLEMRGMIHRLENDKVEPSDKLMFMSVTQMQQARVPGKQGELVHFYPRPILDVLPLMKERSDRLIVLGSALLSKDKKQPNLKYQYRTEMKCRTAGEAKALITDLNDAEAVKNTLEEFIKVKFEMAVVDPKDAKDKKGPKVGVDPKINKPKDIKSADPKDKNKDAKKDLTKKLPVSTGLLEQDNQIARLVLDLNLENYDKETPLKNVVDCLIPLMADAHAELALAEAEDTRHRLAKAGSLLASDPAQKWRKGLPGKGKKIGEFPPAAFPLALKSGALEHDPGRRVSWMTGLLPYLGHQGLYDRVQFGSPWDDLSNWQQGRTLIPEFIDPTYPPMDRYVDHPNLAQYYAATHFVGIAGVGLDAGDPIVRANPNTRRGILGYDRSASLDEIREGRGASTTMLMIRMPRGSLPGFSPWIAGGGATLRGVPENNPLEPFIPKGSDGTYALMGDGSVRFISSRISPAVFTTMASYQVGEVPSDFDEELKKNARLIPPPEK